MAQDVLALGLYTQAKEKMESAFSERHNLANQLSGLVSNATHGNNIMGLEVRTVNIKSAQVILDKMSKLEEEIKSALDVMNANATKCGKTVLKLSGQ